MLSCAMAGTASSGHVFLSHVDLSDLVFFPIQMSFSVCTQHWISTKAHVISPDHSLRRLLMSNLLPVFSFFETYLTSLLRLSSFMAPVLTKK